MKRQPILIILVLSYKLIHLTCKLLTHYVVECKKWALDTIWQ